MLTKLRCFLVCAILIASSLAAAAHGQRFDAAVVIPASGSPSNLAAGDFNRDGHVDIVYQDAYTGGFLHVMINDGTATFREIQEIALPSGVGRQITTADVNGDGYLDLIVGYDGFASTPAPPEFTVLLNHGDGTFGAPIFSTFPIVEEPATAYNHLAVADFDGDGHIDFIFDSAGCGICLMRGDGTGHFTAQVVNIDQGGDAFAGDFNEDGKPDYVVRSDFAVDVGLNKGNNAFTNQTITPSIYFQNDLYVADFNNDGHLDIAYGSNYGLYIALGDGHGGFTTGYPVGSVTGPMLEVRDVNGDGLPDIISANSVGPVALLQNSSGKFSYPSQSGPAVGDKGFVSPVYADFDEDGTPDIISGATGALIFSRGLPGGSFAGAKSYTSVSGSVIDLEVGDLNNDGNPDIVALNGGGGYFGEIYTYLGDGSGNFTGSGEAGGGGLSYGGQSSLADLNADGNLDIFNDGYILYGDGTGQIGSTQFTGMMPQSNRPSLYTVVADFNEDGRPDTAYGTVFNGPGGANGLIVSLSNGASGYTITQIPLPDIPGPMITGDFNHDGHMDIAFVSGTSIYILSGDGKGNFSITQTLPVGYHLPTDNNIFGVFSDLEGADLDLDGNVDLLVPIADQNAIQIFYGRADGTFDAPVKLTTDHDARFVTVADLDLDGKPDLILGGEALVRILHGLGGRKFGSEISLAANPYPQKVRVADVNHDGQPDLLVPNGGYYLSQPGGSFTVLLNTSIPVVSDALSILLVCPPNPSSFGQVITCTAAFNPISNPALPTGSATFTVDGATPVTGALSASGVAVASFASVSVGAHAIAVSYPGDANFAAVVASVAHTVNPTATTTTLTSSSNPSTYLQPVTFTAHVTSASGVPTGSVIFTEAQNTYATVPVDANGNATFTTSTLSANDLGTTSYHLINATFAPTGGFQTSSASLSQVVNGLPSVTNLIVTPTSGTTATTFTMTATVASASPSSTTTPTGEVIFYSSAQTGITGNELGYAPVVNGVATFTSTGLLGGTDYIVGIYFGDNFYASSTSNYVTLTVTAQPTTLTLTSSANPSPALTPVTFTAHLDSAGQPQTGQKINLAYHAVGGNPVLLTQTTDASGNAIFAFPSGFAPATYLVSASFLPTANLQFSGSGLAEVVTANPTATTLTASPASAYQNTVVTLTAVVSATAGAAAPAGTITFLDGATPLSTVALAPSSATTSSATFSTATLSVGTHSLTAIYTPGNTSFLASQSSTFSETINPQDFTLTANPPSITIETQHHASMQLLLSSTGGFAAPITLTCGSPLPPFVTCTLPPPTPLAANGTAPVTLSLDTDGVPNFISSNRTPSLGRLTLAALLPFTLLGLARPRRLRNLLACATLAALAVSLTACANTYPDHTPPGTYTIPITATGTSTGSTTPTSHTLNITLTATQ